MKSSTLQLTRAPETDEELWHVVKAMWGIGIPTKQVCEGHQAPFTAFADAYFARNSWNLWYGSRGTGKSLQLALLGLTQAALKSVDVTLLGGSMAQSQNVQEHVEAILRYRNAPTYSIAKQIKTEILFKAGNWIRPLPASQKTVRGPHPTVTLLDEIDEMDSAVYDAAQGQAMTQTNPLGERHREVTVASSTWQNPDGVFSRIIGEAREKKLPIFTWCYKEVLEPHGWMEPDFIERKRLSVPANMFRTEYLLGEPSGTSRAFDIELLEEAFKDLGYESRRVSTDDMEYVFSDPLKYATYAAGADWAKESDYTVVTVFRTDIKPFKCVYFRKTRRRPWPQMIANFNKIVNKYKASSAHDATGLGNVVSDLVDERTSKVVMVGTARTKLLTSYITAVEAGHYVLPRNTDAYDAHKKCTAGAVFYPGKTNSHLPDEVASAALAHRAAGPSAQVAPGEVVTRDKKMKSWVTKLDYPEELTDEQAVNGRVGDVNIIDETGNVDVFWS